MNVSEGIGGAVYVVCRKCAAMWRGKPEEYTLCPLCGSCNLRQIDTDWLYTDEEVEG